MHRVCWLTLVPLMCTVGCISGLDERWEVKDLRVLAVRAEPPEIMYSLSVDPGTGFPRFGSDGLPIFTPSQTRITFDALVVDPRGGEVEYTWRLCPVASGSACFDYQTQRDKAPEELRGGLDTLHDMSSTGMASAAPGDRSAVPAMAVPPFVLDVPPELFTFHFQDSFLGAGFGAWPSVTLEVRHTPLPGDGFSEATDHIIVEKRFVLSMAPSTIRSLLALAEAAGQEGQADNPFGISFCPAGKTQRDLPNCLLLTDRIANTNPVFADVQFSWGPSSDTTWIDIPGVPQLYPFEEIRLLPSFTAASSEGYQFLKADLDTREIFLADRQESMSVNWYTNSGDLQDGFTWPQFTKSLDTTYRAPTEPLERTNGRVQVWMVALDQRGGTAWTSIELEVVPPSQERQPDPATRGP